MLHLTYLDNQYSHLGARFSFMYVLAISGFQGLDMCRSTHSCPIILSDLKCFKNTLRKHSFIYSIRILDHISSLSRNNWAPCSISFSCSIFISSSLVDTPRFADRAAAVPAASPNVMQFGWALTAPCAT